MKDSMRDGGMEIDDSPLKGRNEGKDLCLIFSERAINLRLLQRLNESGQKLGRVSQDGRWFDVQQRRRSSR